MILTAQFIVQIRPDIGIVIHYQDAVTCFGSTTAGTCFIQPPGFTYVSCKASSCSRPITTIITLFRGSTYTWYKALPSLIFHAFGFPGTAFFAYAVLSRTDTDVACIPFDVLFTCISTGHSFSQGFCREVSCCG